MSAEATALLERRVRSGALSARGLDRVRRLARTVADLAAVGPQRDGHPTPDDDTIGIGHVHEALLLRCQREFLLGGGQ